MTVKLKTKSTNIVKLTPNIIVLIILVSIAGACRTSGSSYARNRSSAKLQDSLLSDSEGNTYPVKILSGGNLWMTSNLNWNIPNSYCYDNRKENCKQYGRLYTWESAKQGCKLLGEGWRLPTNDEWLQLTQLYKDAGGDSNATRKNAYKALLYPGTSAFNALLGGGRSADSQYSRLDAHGFYWTSTENDNSTAWFYNFGKGSQALYQQDGGEKTRAFSVRCVKSVAGLK